MALSTFLEYSTNLYYIIRDQRLTLIYAYIRVSSRDQNTGRQEEAISGSGFCIDKIYTDKASGKDVNRPFFQEMLNVTKPGDTIVVSSIDRMCRNMMDMCSVTTDLRDRGVSLVFLQENLTFSSGKVNAMQELQLHMMSAFSQFERALVKERQADGIAAKKARGEKTGRPAADSNKIPAIEALCAKGINLKLACENVGLGVSTYYKLRKQLARSH